MKKYGIIAAMQEEMQEIEKIMEEKQNQKIYELNFITGKINSTDVVLVEAGIGKVNAARTNQILIDNFKIDAIIASLFIMQLIWMYYAQELSVIIQHFI